jgi:hypothetical protein
MLGYKCPLDITETDLSDILKPEFESLKGCPCGAQYDVDGFLR